MSMFEKAKDLIGKNKDKAMQGIDVAAQQARKVTPAKHQSKLDKAADAARGAVHKIDGGDTTDPAAAGGDPDSADDGSGASPADGDGR